MLFRVPAHYICTDVALPGCEPGPSGERESGARSAWFGPRESPAGAASPALGPIRKVLRIAPGVSYVLRHASCSGVPHICTHLSS